MNQAAIESIAQSIQPLVFETGIDEAPYSMWGTTFLVGYKGRSFVLTARHTLKPEMLGPICIFPSDESNRLLPLHDVLFVPQADVGDDFADLAVIEIDVESTEH